MYVHTGSEMKMQWFVFIGLTDYFDLFVDILELVSWMTEFLKLETFENMA